METKRLTPMNESISKGMNKTNIYVSVRTEEECKKAATIMIKYKENVLSGTAFNLNNGVINELYSCLNFVNGEWRRDLVEFVEGNNKTLITLDQLESMLCGKGEETGIKTKNDFLKEQGINPETDFSIPVYTKIRFAMEEHTKHETSSLRRELEEKEKEIKRLKEIIDSNAQFD